LDTKKNKRKEICDVAAKLFSEKGFKYTSTRDISKAAGMSDAGIYYYFRNKESLLIQVTETILKTGLEPLRRIDRSDMTFEEKFAAFTKYYTRYFSPETDNMKLLAEDEKSVKPANKKRINKLQREFLDILVRILDGLKENGRMVDLDSTLCAFAFFSMIHWQSRWYNPKGKMNPEQLSEIFYYILTRGIYPR
jgi:AcrR family transcriptional regulator